MYLSSIKKPRQKAFFHEKHQKVVTHIPAKKRFVFLITADKIQPIENFR